jgi:hypothetical protein
MIVSLVVCSRAFQIPLPEKSYASLRNGTSAYKSLISNAEKQLVLEILPVTAKEKLAPSGDIHDYVSMAPYWWPNPSTPDGLPYIRKDGDRNPEIYDYDRYKLDDFIKNIVWLGWAYYFGADLKYAQKAAENIKLFLLNDDTKMNPHLQYGQMVPGVDNGNGRAEGIIDVYDMVGVMPCVEILVDAGVFTSSEVVQLKKWYSDLVDWLLTSDLGKEERATKNNHAVAFDVIVTSFSLFCDRVDVYTPIIKSFGSDRLFVQIEPDGSQPQELSRTTALHYSNYNLDHMLDMAVRAKQKGIDIYGENSGGRSIGSAVAFLAKYVGKPQSEFPYQQSGSWDTEQTILAWILKRSTQFKANSEYSDLFNQFAKTSASDRRWLIIGGYPEANE